ncbi:MAG: MFS transporter [Phycisphaeraceae bacterium]|nr:MFS transporter [Phycisphaeraceae bacterium]
MPPRHDPYAAMKSVNYRRFVGGWVFSSTALQMLSAAIAWEIYERTGSAMALGLAGLARALPVVLMALPAGHAIDLYDRRRVLSLTQGGFAILCAAFAVASWTHAPVWCLFLLITLTGCVRSCNGPARSALLPLIVPPDVFQNAVAWNSGVFQLSAVAGPLLAGGIIHVTGQAWPVYAAASAGCLIFAVSASLVKPVEAPRTTGGMTVESMVAGMGHVWREKTVLAAISLDMFAVLLGGATALMPIYAEILHVGSVGYGALRAAPYAGAFAMAIILAHQPPFRRAGRALLLSVAAFGGATIVFGVSQWFWLSLGALAFAGAVDNVSVVIRHILVQVRTPNEIRGRVGAVNSVFIESSNELGAFESGAVAQAFGPVVSVVSGGIGTILVVAGIAWLWPEIRRLGPLDEIAATEGAKPRKAPARPADPVTVQ